MKYQNYKSNTNNKSVKLKYKYVYTKILQYFFILYYIYNI